jgi:hypothetical protein
VGVGSPAIAALVAQTVFFVLLAYGWFARMLDVAPCAIVAALWIAGAIGFPYLPYGPARAMFSSYVAVLDVALVFLIFKGDVPLS